MDSQYAIVLDSVTKTFLVTDKFKKKVVKTVVDNVSFSVKKNIIYCLLGNNGAGKTTTLRMLSGLLKPTSGEIKYGEETSKVAISKKIGFLSSDLKLDATLTPKYLFEFYGKIFHLTQNEIKERKELLFSLLGISEYENQRISTLSTGMNQKISIAISLVHDPDIVIFDEPTNGLDIITTREIINFIKMMKENGKTIILSTHIFSLVEELADRIGIIMDGELVFDDNRTTIPSSIEEMFFNIYNRKGNVHK